MKVTFIGTGDAFGSGGRFNTCIMIDTDNGRRFLIDYGATSPVGLKKLGVDPNSIDAIFITHLHGDHFGGLPFFLLDAQFSKRNSPLVLVGPATFKQRLREAREIFFSGSSETVPKFDLVIDEFTVGELYGWSGLTITPFEVDHFCGAPPLAVRIEHEGKVVAYTGDTQWTDTLIEVCADADLMIAEAYYFEKKIKWHLDYASLMANIDRIKPKRLVITHMSEDMLARVDEVDCDVAEDGKVFEI